METLHWFGVDVSFSCPVCNHRSEEKMALSASLPDDYDSVNKAINHEKLVCQHCRKPLVEGTAVSVHVHPGTPEQLKQMGYPLPPDM